MVNDAPVQMSITECQQNLTKDQTKQAQSRHKPGESEENHDDIPTGTNDVHYLFSVSIYVIADE